MNPNLFSDDIDSASHLDSLGFKLHGSSVHLARTIMIDELEMLLSYVSDADTPRSAYKEAILNDNCLGKRSSKSKELTLKHLSDLYILDQSVPLFRSFLYFWKRDSGSHPLLALTLAATRDPFIRLTAPFIAKHQLGEIIKRESLEAFFEKEFPHRYSPAMLKSLAQNINSSWTKTGHLSGRHVKTRSQAQPRAANLAFAIMVSHLMGVRGLLLLESEYVKMLDASRDNAITLAEEASAKGWMIFKRIGDVVDVSFPHLTNPTYSSPQ
jgi:hypothetical protein